uniref:cytochrome c oxidase assembly factor 1 homolog isoform X2 n=1 Tax=Halichoerus grypus TaxID=9711 RepID=UPI001658CDED|nr:cytochrome c oxidase assembly factor 1 homolog isoform X2 [Halichoerus grypus]
MLSVPSTPFLKTPAHTGRMLQQCQREQLSFDDFQEGCAVKWQSVVASGTCTLTYYLIQKAFSKASYYQEALEQLHGHPEALEALGTPLNVHCLRLTDKYNFVDIAEAQLKIPVSGPKSEGHLHVISSRDAPFQRETIFWFLSGGTFRRSS